MWLFWWCIQSICSVESYFLGVLSFGGIVGSSYVIVYAAKWAIIYMCIWEWAGVWVEVLVPIMMR